MVKIKNIAKLFKCKDKINLCDRNGDKGKSKI